MVTFKFTVHRAHESLVSKPVVVEGEEVSATVPSYEVELVSDQGTAYTHRFVGKAAREAAEELHVGDVVSCDLNVE